MILRNKSRYPTEEVLALIKFAGQGLNTSKVCINVRNSTHAYAGYAYAKVPKISNAPRSCKYLVTLRIGKESKFPVNNVHTTYRWVRVKEGETWPQREMRSRDGILERMVISKHPYGGKKSVVVEMRDWREGIIAIAAHELRHVKQFREKLVLSERACEKFALERLTAWRLANYDFRNDAPEVPRQASADEHLSTSGQHGCAQSDISGRRSADSRVDSPGDCGLHREAATQDQEVSVPKL